MQHLATENNYMAELNNKSTVKVKKLKQYKFFTGSPYQNCRVSLVHWITQCYLTPDTSEHTPP